MKQIIDQIKHLSESFHHEVVDIRRHLHKNPELSFCEFETSKFIQKKLLEYGVSFQSGIVKTGVVALIEGQNPSSKCIALRADIDALPIQEANQLEYCSLNKGVMHACGHDVHTASLLGVARILNCTKDSWQGSVKLIFQPGEEKLPGGASLMIKEGVLKNPDVDVILGQHVSPELLAGQVGIKAGMFMASADELYLDVKGVGGHAAIPKGSVNPLKISAEIISVLYKHFDNKENIILSLGAINGGTLGNIIPEQVSIKGTFRAMNEDKRFQAHKDIIEICQSIAKDLGGSCNVEIKVGYPFLKNHTDLTSFCKQNLNLFLEKENVIDISKRMTAEDFAFYSHYVPACFYRLGVGFDGEDARKLHHPNFDIDESALLTSVGVMSFLAISYLLQK